jgi:hypothetical protein
MSKLCCHLNSSRNRYYGSDSYRAPIPVGIRKLGSSLMPYLKRGVEYKSYTSRQWCIPFLSQPTFSSLMSVISTSLALMGLLSLASARFVPAQRDQQKGQNTIRWVDCHERIPDIVEEAFNITTSTPLPSSLFCGGSHTIPLPSRLLFILSAEMDVPMDYTKPFHPYDNNITIGFAMNRPKKPEGVIV